MSTVIRYSQAERITFKLVPETCPAVEGAIDKAFSTPGVSDETIAQILAKYDIAADKRMGYAINEILSRFLFDRKMALSKVVLYEGTFPLRSALVELVKARDGLADDRNRFSEWIQMQQSTAKVAK